MTSTRTAGTIALAFGVMLSLGGLAEARFRVGLDRASDADIPEGFLPETSAATGRLCVKQCPDDSSPCDPPVYKHADGRCTTQWR